MDVDGILTDGRIVMDDEGRETKFFDVRDGFGIVMFRKAGFKTAIISARPSRTILHRAKDLSIDKVVTDTYPKIGAYESMLKEFGFKDEEACYMGDDLPDLDIMQKVGFAVSVPDGRPEVRQSAHYVTTHRGGRGAVREVIEMIMKAQTLRNWPVAKEKRKK